MPYKNEMASKISHERIVNLTEVAEKLKKFRVVYDCPEEKLNSVSALFKPIEILKEDIQDIRYVFTVDSSQYDLPINDMIPSAKVGIVTFGGLVVDLQDVNASLKLGQMLGKK